MNLSACSSHGDDVLPPRVRAHFAGLTHAGILSDAEGERRVGEAGAEALGTRVRFHLRLRDGRIAEARFQGYGCPYTLAACDWLAGQLVGRVPSEALAGGPLEWVGELDIPMERLGRLLVVEDALRAAGVSVEKPDLAST